MTDTVNIGAQLFARQAFGQTAESQGLRVCFLLPDSQGFGAQMGLGSLVPATLSRPIPSILGSFLAAVAIQGPVRGMPDKVKAAVGEAMQALSKAHQDGLQALAQGATPIQAMHIGAPDNRGGGHEMA